MNVKVKLGVYAVLLLMAAGFGWGFHASYSVVTKESAAAANGTEAEAGETPSTTETPTNLASSNAVAGGSNQVAPQTNAAAAPNPPAHTAKGRSVGFLAALVVSIIALGLLLAYDATQFFGNVAVDALLDVAEEGSRDPDYEKAEQVWVKGDHLEAIQMLRDFLKKNPRAQYAALRIAEIYEKDLGNYLAAALEYEEVLKKKLPPERWAWAAIHLCNLYSKLGQQDKLRALLQRVADEYPKTAAAKKARARLGLPEPEPEQIVKAGPAGDPGEALAESEEEEAPAPSAAAPEPPKSNLPPGFRPK